MLHRGAHRHAGQPVERGRQPGYEPDPRHAVPLDDVTQWWRYVPGASWRHPGGPDTHLQGRGAWVEAQRGHLRAADTDDATKRGALIVPADDEGL